MLSDPPLTFVIVMVSVTWPDGPPPLSTSITSCAEKPSELTSLQPMVARAPT
jgi:hypothetical protein